MYEHTFVYITRASKYWKKYVVVFFFLAQLDEGPETPCATREASGVPFLRQDEA